MSDQKFPAIPASTSNDPELRKILDAVREIIETRESIRGDKVEAFVRFKDLIDGNIANVNATLATRPIATASADLLKDTSIPPAPTGLAAADTFSNIMLTWDRIPYRNHAYTEIWRDTVNTIGTATMIGTSEGTIYVDAVNPGTTYYYWVKFRSDGDIVGPFNATTGVAKSTSKTVTQLMSDIGDSIERSDLHSVLSTDIGTLEGQYVVKINSNGKIAGFGLANTSNAAGSTSMFEVVADKFAIVHANVSGTQVPFVVDAGNVYISTAFIKNASIDDAKIANLSVSKLVSTAAWINSADINDLQITSAKIAGAIQSNNYNPSTGVGWYISKTGGNAVFGSVTIYDGNGNAVITSGTGINHNSIDTALLTDSNNNPLVTSVTPISHANVSTYIQSLAVDTLQIADNAVTVPVVATDATYHTIGASQGQLIQLTIPSYPDTIEYLVTYNGMLRARGSSVSFSAVFFNRYINGTVNPQYYVGITDYLARGSPGFIYDGAFTTYSTLVVPANTTPTIGYGISHAYLNGSTWPYDMHGQTLTAVGMKK